MGRRLEHWDERKEVGVVGVQGITRTENNRVRWGWCHSRCHIRWGQGGQGKQCGLILSAVGSSETKWYHWYMFSSKTFPTKAQCLWFTQVLLLNWEVNGVKCLRINIEISQGLISNLFSRNRRTFCDHVCIHWRASAFWEPSDWSTGAETPQRARPCRFLQVIGPRMGFQWGFPLPAAQRDGNCLQRWFK